MSKFSTIGGRKAIYVPSHPKANSSGYVLLSRHLVETRLGRYLEEWEEVHHQNGDHTDDSETNLLLTTDREHPTLHRKLDYNLIRRLRALGLGYKRIAARTGYARSSIQSACKVMGC